MIARTILAGLLAAAQSTSTLEVDVNLVNVFVTVQDANGAYVRGLGPDDFRIYEDGLERPIQLFESDDDLRSSLGVLIDSSGSSADIMGSIRSGVNEFVSEGGLMDETFVIAFGTSVDLIFDYGEDPDQLSRQLDSLRPWGASVFFDAVLLGIEKAAMGQRVRKALVVLSDGGDNGSRTPYREVLRAAESSSVLLYFIGLGPRILVDAYTMEGLASLTGGRVWLLGPEAEIGDLLGEIREDLAHQYYLGYYASDAPGYHTIRVETTAANVTVRAREGYSVSP